MIFTRGRICLTIIFIVFIFIVNLSTIPYFSNYIVDIKTAQFNSSLCPYSSIITDNRITFDNTSYSIHHYPEFICPQNFRNMADWVYAWPDYLFDEHIETSFNKLAVSIPNLPNGSIIYIKTDGIPSFFSKIYPHLQNKFVLISGQSDYSVPGNYLHYLEKSDSKIIHWFGQNGKINKSTNKRFTHIPIGLNCYEMAESIRSVHRQYSNYTLPRLVNNSISEPSHYIQPFDMTQRVLNDSKQFNKILLLNFRPENDPTRVRSQIWKKICENNDSSYAICFTKPGGVDPTVLPAIYKRNRQYPLWLSPPGNGIDCHRTWEALYLDIVPIVWHSTLDPLYENLPIIIINDINEINEEFLQKKLHEISLKKLQQPPIYQYEKLRNAFWHEMILRKSRHSLINTHIHRNRCWRAKNIK